MILSINTLGRVLMTLAMVVFTFIPPLADLATDTHVFHPGWMPHARVHTVWLLGLTSSIGLVSLYLLWFRKIDSNFNENLAGISDQIAMSRVAYRCRARHGCE